MAGEALLGDGGALFHVGAGEQLLDRLVGAVARRGAGRGLGHGYDIAVTETAPGTAAAATVPDEPIEKLLASANLEKGATIAKKCLACHDFTKGGPNKVGPNLWGILDRDKGAISNFAYSTNFKKMMQGHWTIDDLNKYLINPKAMVPGTSMAFIGLNKGSERADVIAYLNSLSDSPKPLPKAQ